MNIHVANVNVNLIESDIHRMFAPFGEVKAMQLIRDSLNNRSRGRTLIEMPVNKEGEKAILNLNRLEIKGKFIVVSEIMYGRGMSA